MESINLTDNILNNDTELKIFNDIKSMFEGIIDNFQFDSDIDLVTENYTAEELDIFNNMITYFELNYTVDRYEIKDYLLNAE